MTQAEYIAALRAKLVAICERTYFDADDVRALVAIEPDGRFEVNPIVRTKPAGWGKEAPAYQVCAASHPAYPLMVAPGYDEP